MAKVLALSTSVALVVFGISGTVQAQSVIHAEGTIQAVDCATNTLTLDTADGVSTFTASAMTAVSVGTVASSFCALAGYVGSDAMVWATASGNEVLAGRVEVVPAYAAPSYVAPYDCEPYYGPSYGYYGPCVYPYADPGIYIGPRLDYPEFHGPHVHRPPFNHPDVHSGPSFHGPTRGGMPHGPFGGGAPRGFPGNGAGHDRR
jgi:hypothetical protein